MLTDEDLRSGFLIGDWEVLPAQGLLRSGDSVERPEPRVMGVLIALAKRDGDLVTRDELVDELWGGRPTSDEPINRCLSQLRGHLGDRDTPHRYVETLSRRGYRLLEKVRPLEAGIQAASRPRRVLRRWPAVAAAAGIAAILVAALFSRNAPVPQPDDVVPSIGVLPFQNLSGDPDQEFFADGISEELLNVLARIPEIRVISRTSAFSYKGKNVGPATIARELKVAHLLDGSVRRSGERVRVAAQLIHAHSDQQLWSRTFDRQFGDIFDIQEEIAAAIVQQLRVRLVHPAPAVRKTSPEAYALYLRAQYLSHRFTQTDIVQANDLFGQVLALDPGYAPAWDGIANNHVLMAGYGMVPIEEGFRLASAAIDEALALDPGLAHAHALRGRMARHDNDLAAAARHYQRALELDPAHDDIIRGTATLLLSLGRIEEALAFNEFSVDIDPVNAMGYGNLGQGYLMAGRLDDAIDACRTALHLSPQQVAGHYCVGEALLFKGETQEALAEFGQEDLESLRLVGSTMAYHALGRSGESDEALAKLIDEHGLSWAVQIAYVYDYRNEPDKALEWLHKAVEYRDPGLSEIFVGDLYFSNLRKDSRWLPFLESIGYAPHQLAAIRFDVSAPPGLSQRTARAERVETPGDRAPRIANGPVSTQIPVDDEEDSHLGDFVENTAAVSLLGSATS